MKKQELIEWAIKGIGAEIDKHEKNLNKAYQYLLSFEKGEKPNITRTEEEIKDYIRSKKHEIQQLDKMKFDLKWQQSELNDK